MEAEGQVFKQSLSKRMVRHHQCGGNSSLMGHCSSSLITELNFPNFFANRICEHCTVYR